MPWGIIKQTAIGRFCDRVVNNMESKDQIIERLKVAGYITVHEYDDAAGEYFADHTHPGEEHLIVIRGSLEVNMDGKHYVCNTGDELNFPQMMVHDARIGQEGCFYIVGEKEPV